MIILVFLAVLFLAIIAHRSAGPGTDGQPRPFFSAVGIAIITALLLLGAWFVYDNFGPARPTNHAAVLAPATPVAAAPPAPPAPTPTDPAAENQRRAQEIARKYRRGR